jgi:hypothetical protein
MLIDPSPLAVRTTPILGVAIHLSLRGPTGALIREEVRTPGGFRKKERPVDREDYKALSGEGFKHTRSDTWGETLRAVPRPGQGVLNGVPLDAD